LVVSRFTSHFTASTCRREEKKNLFIFSGRYRRQSGEERRGEERRGEERRGKCSTQQHTAHSTRHTAHRTAHSTQHTAHTEEVKKNY
jgi:hypothetical protein